MSKNKRVITCENLVNIIFLNIYIYVGIEDGYNATLKLQKNMKQNYIV